MIRLAVDEKQEAHRANLRSWLSTQSPPQGEPSFETEDAIQRARRWQRTIFDSGFLAPSWPKEFGGGGKSIVEEIIVQEELARARSQQLIGLFGLTMVGPVLLRHGTLQQRERFLPKILRADEIWCQGFSEAGAGSDLAGIKTRAVRDGDILRLQGTKIWTSLAHMADWCFVLCRTDAASQRHEGLTYLLVSMRSPGISVRPLRQISGDSEFNEVQFDNVEVPIDQVVGGMGDGWNIAVRTLMFERAILTFSRHLQSESALRELLEQQSTPCAQAQLASHIASACAVRACAYEHLVQYAHGADPGSEGSIDKLFWSESFQQIASFALEQRGRLGVLGTGSEELHRYLYSRGRTIAAGSSEIQRNIIADRVLRLPRLTYQC